MRSVLIEARWRILRGRGWDRPNRSPDNAVGNRKLCVFKTVINQSDVRVSWQTGRAGSYLVRRPGVPN